jgi:gluconokinase
MKTSIIILMGVCGSGKSTIGSRLASKINYRYIDADDFHPSTNLEKLKNNQPLTDEDRLPWLILTKELQPQFFCFFLLHASTETLLQRLNQRTNHFVTAALLNSQLSTLEITPDLKTIDITPTPEEIISQIQSNLTEH